MNEINQKNFIDLKIFPFILGSLKSDTCLLSSLLCSLFINPVRQSAFYLSIKLLVLLQNLFSKITENEKYLLSFFNTLQLLALSSLNNLLVI